MRIGGIHRSQPVQNETAGGTRPILEVCKAMEALINSPTLAGIAVGLSQVWRGSFCSWIHAQGIVPACQLFP